jgi:hypothetical protein
MMSVNIVRPLDLDHDELKLLIRYSHECWKPFPIEELVKRVDQGTACIYRVLGEGVKGIFILSAGEGDLYVELVAGKGFIKHFAEVYDAIRETAICCGAKEIYGFVGRPGLKRLYDRYTKGVPLVEVYKEKLL